MADTRFADPVLRDIAQALRSHPSLTSFARERMITRLRELQQMVSDHAPASRGPEPGAAYKKGR